MRTKSSEPTSSTSESATCETTRTRRNPNRSRPAVIPREAVFSTLAGATLVARSAGVRSEEHAGEHGK